MASAWLTVVFLMAVNVFDVCEPISTRKLISRLEDKIYRLEDTVTAHEDKRLAQEEVMSAQEEVMSAQDDKISVLTKKLEDTEAELEAVKTDVSVTKLERIIQGNDLIEVKVKIKSTDHKVNFLHNTVDALNSEVLDLSSGLEAVKVNATSAKQERILQEHVLQDKVNSLSKKVDTLTSGAIQFSSGLDTVKRTLQTTQQEVDAQDEKISVLTKKLKDTEAELEAVKTDVNNTVNALNSAVTTDSTGTIPQSLLPVIPQSLLPGSYADLTVEDMMWGSIHMVATAVCQDKGSSWGYVFAVTPGSTCTATCSAFWMDYTCVGVVHFRAKMGHMTTDTTMIDSEVGFWDSGYNCDVSTIWSELRKEDGDIRYYSDLQYCCCSTYSAVK